MRAILTAVRSVFRIPVPANQAERPPAGMIPPPHRWSLSKEKRRLGRTALGMILLGLWGMLALLLGASVGRESNYRRTLNADLQPGFGETHATRHSLDADKPHDLPPPCLTGDCPGVRRGADTAFLEPPLEPPGVPGDDVDDATSAIGGQRAPQAPPSFTQGHSSDPFPNWLFVPQGGGDPGGPDSGNPIPGGPNDNPPQKPDNPPDFTQPPYSNPDGPGRPDAPGGPAGPGGPDNPPKDAPQTDPPLQIPEPLTLSLFVAGLAGFLLLRRRWDHLSK